MILEHVESAREAYRSTIAARRQVVRNLALSNDIHNRAELLQVEQTLAALIAIIGDEERFS
jgi:hypothetical protein